MSVVNYPAYGHAVIEVNKNPPGEVFEETWYSVDFKCHGCWHNCGGSGHCDFDKLDAELERLKKRLLTCDQNENPSQKPPRVKIIDCRDKQVTLDLFGKVA